MLCSSYLLRFAACSIVIHNSPQFSSLDFSNKIIFYPRVVTRDALRNLSNIGAGTQSSTILARKFHNRSLTVLYTSGLWVNSVMNRLKYNSQLLSLMHFVFYGKVFPIFMSDLSTESSSSLFIFSQFLNFQFSFLSAR